MEKPSFHLLLNRRTNTLNKQHEDTIALDTGQISGIRNIKCSEESRNRKIRLASVALFGTLSR